MSSTLEGVLRTKGIISCLNRCCSKSNFTLQKFRSLERCLSSAGSQFHTWHPLRSLLSQLAFHEYDCEDSPNYPESPWQAPSYSDSNVLAQLGNQEGRNDGNADQTNSPCPILQQQHASESRAHFISLGYGCSITDSSLAFNRSGILHEC